MAHCLNDSSSQVWARLKPGTGASIDCLLRNISRSLGPKWSSTLMWRLTHCVTTLVYARIFRLSLGFEKVFQFSFDFRTHNSCQVSFFIECGVEVKAIFSPPVYPVVPEPFFVGGGWRGVTSLPFPLMKYLSPFSRSCLCQFVSGTSCSTHPCVPILASTQLYY